MSGDDAGIQFEADGQIGIGSEFTRPEEIWMTGVAAMARTGARIIVVDYFLRGPSAQPRWRQAVAGLNVLWVGCTAPAVASARETARGDRGLGMASPQAVLVRRGLESDVEVDTTHCTASHAASLIVASVERRATMEGISGSACRSGRCDLERPGAHLSAVPTKSNGLKSVSNAETGSAIAVAG
jgi:chloramphenicol 3-O phosphotransferase